MKNHCFHMPCQCPTADIGQGRGWGLVVLLTVSEAGGAMGMSHGVATRASLKGFLQRRLHARLRGWSSGGTGRLLTPQGSPGPGPLSEGIKVPVFPCSFLSAPSTQTSDRSFCVPRPQTDPSVSRSLGRAVLPWSAALSLFDEPSGGEWEGWASSLGVAVGCPVAELEGRTPGLGHTQVPAEAQRGLWETAWLRAVVQASPPWLP